MYKRQYLMNLLISLIFMIPGGIVWIADVKTDLPHFALFLSAAFFVPLVPMCLASAISLLIVLASSHFKNRNIVSLLLSFAALGLVGYLTLFILKDYPELQYDAAIEKSMAMMSGRKMKMFLLSLIHILIKFSVTTLPKMFWAVA